MHTRPAHKVQAAKDYPNHACVVSTSADGYVVECLYCGPIAEHTYLAAAHDRAETHSKARIPTHA